ncbi:phage major capsid protein [Halorarum salinum]|uniref:Phage major capsid protein n=1 Tax=Halorarum salinum TaxID=2743089 RepID=A0A7D5QLJ0_9EURY|nr:hypothetical protein [Halobaculum salinum]QLG62825.1 hypothetical protein HUG12_14250 [Halobaculum salinum]
MTRLDAQRKLRQHGQTGNWRFKGLLLANLSGTGVSRQDVAKAWPTKPSEYRFLQANPGYSPEQEATRTAIVEEGSEEHHMLSDYADDELEEVDHELHEAHVDRSIQHMLFATSTPEEVDVLFRDQLADVVAEGARQRQMARNGSFIFNADTTEGTITVGEDDEYNYESGSGGIAEGGAIRDDSEDPSTVSWDCKKVGRGARITDEMTRHARIDIIEREVQRLGRVTENDMNRIWLNELVDGANQNHDTAGSDQGVPALNGGVTEVDKQDFMPDTFVSHPEFRGVLFDDSNLVEVNRAGQDAELRERELARVMGIDHLPMTGSAYDSSTNSWSYDTDGDYGAVVYQQEHMWLVIEQDIEIKDYEDPIRDLQGVNARAWVDADYAQTDAAATVEY